MRSYGRAFKVSKGSTAPHCVLGMPHPVIDTTGEAVSRGVNVQLVSSLLIIGSHVSVGLWFYSINIIFVAGAIAFSLCCGDGPFTRRVCDDFCPHCITSLMVFGLGLTGYSIIYYSLKQ